MDARKYIHGLITEGEHAQQDFKYKVSDAPKLARSVSAFANTGGGRLLVGVRDDGHISGVRSEEEIYMLAAAAGKFCRPAAAISFETFAVDGRTVVVATVPPAARKPVCAIDDDGRARAYVRMADENIVASPVHLAIWREQGRQRVLTVYADDERRLMASMQAAPPLTLNQIQRRCRLPRHKVVGLLARLVRYELATCQYAGGRFLFALRQ